MFNEIKIILLKGVVVNRVVLGKIPINMFIFFCKTNKGQISIYFLFATTSLTAYPLLYHNISSGKICPTNKQIFRVHIYNTLIISELLVY